MNAAIHVRTTRHIAGMALAALLCAVVALLLARVQMDTPAVFRNCALVQGIAPVLGTALGTLQKGMPDLSYATYGTFFSWFAFMGIASEVVYQYGHRTSVSD